MVQIRSVGAAISFDAATIMISQSSSPRAGPGLFVKSRNVVKSVVFCMVF